jgi:hypothetical protein
VNHPNPATLPEPPRRPSTPHRTAPTSRRSTRSSSSRPPWYILVANTSQIHDGATLRRLIDKAGFDLVARRRDLPHVCVKR